MNLVIICIFILNILLILQVIYHYKELKNDKKIKKLFLFIAFGFMLFPIKTFALETLFIGNGTVLNRCTSNICAYPYSGTTNYRAFLDNYNFNVDETYTFNLYFNATTGVASPTLTDCGLNINGAYVTPQSRNSGRTTYECNSGYTRCDSSYVSTIVWTASSSLSNVPVFIQCDMTPQSATYTYTQFTTSVNSSNGSVISAIEQANNNLINTQNYNANQNNANRDSNTDRQINNQNNLFSGLTNTLNTIKSYIGDKIDSVGTGISNVISGLTTGFGNVVTAVGNIVTPIVDAVGNVGSSIINTGQSIISAIGNGISSVVNKVGELIGLNEVCTTYYYSNGTNVLYGNSNVGLLQSDGTFNTNSNYRTTEKLNIDNNQSFKIDYRFGSTPGTDLRICYYNGYGNLLSCNYYWTRSDSNSGTFNYDINSSSSVRSFAFSYPVGSPNTTIKAYGNCHQSGIVGIFNSITSFFGKMFSPLTDIWNNISVGLADNTPISDLLTLPINLLNNINTSLSGPPTRSGSGGGVHDCQSYTIPFDFTGGNNTLTFPCIDLERYLGSDVWSWIDIILTGFMIFQIALMVIHFFESWTTFKDTFDELYVPNHGTYIPRHSGGDRGLFD